MPEPVDKELYNSIKTRIYAQRKRSMIRRWKQLGKDTSKVTGHSAYAVGQVIQEYKRKFKDKHGDRASPYRGKKTPTKGLARWYKEQWKTDSGDSRYTAKDSVFRPTKRVTKDTPTTFSELSIKQLKSAKQQKKRGERASFKKNS